MIYFSFFAVFFIFLLLYLKVSEKFNIFDFPNSRKIHKVPIPTIGGLIIFTTLFVHIGYIDLHHNYLIILFSSFLILFVGFVDDVFQIGVISRLLSQIIASLIVVGSGIKIIDIGDYSIFPVIDLGPFGLLLSVFSIMCLINAINFIDGIDGLSSCSVVVSLISILLFSFFEGNFIFDELIFAFIVVLLIFIFFNLGFIKKYKMFLGDAGSTTIGFMLACILIFYAHHDHRFFHPVLAIWCITLPIFDFLAVIIRRVRSRINPFKPDNRHIHHLLISKNISPMSTLIILVFFSFLSNMLGGAIFYIFGSLMCLISYVLYFSVFFVFCEYFLVKKNKLT